MSISSLTTEATRLIGVFQDKEDEIDAALAAALVAAADMDVVAYVDSIGPSSDSNAGTALAPFATLNKALSLAQTGVSLTVYLANDGNYSWSNIIHASNCVIRLYDWVPTYRSVGVQPKPIITQGAIYSTNETGDQCAMLYGVNSHVHMRSCVFKTAVHTLAGRPWLNWWEGIVSSPGSMVRLALISTDLELNDAAPASAQGGVQLVLKTSSVTRTVLTTPLIRLDNAFCMASIVSVTFDPTIALADMIEGVERSVLQVPVNFLSNVVI